MLLTWWAVASLSWEPLALARSPAGGSSQSLALPIMLGSNRISHVVLPPIQQRSAPRCRCTPSRHGELLSTVSHMLASLMPSMLNCRWSARAQLAHYATSWYQTCSDGWFSLVSAIPKLNRGDAINVSAMVMIMPLDGWSSPQGCISYYVDVIMLSLHKRSDSVLCM